MFLAGAPLIANSVFDITTATLGVFVGGITADFMLGNFLTTRLIKRFKASTIMLAGRLVACGGLLLGLLILAAGAVTPLLYFGGTIFVGIGNGLTTPNSHAGAMAVRPRLAGSAAGITGALTLAGGALLATVTGLALTNAPSPHGLLLLMLLASVAGLAAAVAAVRLEARAAKA